MSKFVAEARKVDGKPYPASTLYQLVCGLARSLRTNDPDIQLFSDSTFAPFRDTLDSRMKELKASGIDRPRQAGALTVEMEETLWQQGLLGDSTPQQLLDTGLLCRALFSVEEWPGTSQLEALSISAEIGQASARCTIPGVPRGCVQNQSRRSQALQEMC